MKPSLDRFSIGFCRSGHFQYRQVGKKYWGQLPSGEIHEYNTLREFVDAIIAENKLYDALAAKAEEKDYGRRVLAECKS